MKKILVTGATGFLGSHLLRRLVNREAGQIIALRRSDSSMELVKDVAEKVDWQVSDILDQDGLFEACKNIDEIYHCAAIVSYHPALQQEMKKVNVEGTALLVNMALAQGVKRILHVSSIAALGRVLGTKEVDENAKWAETKFVSHYGRTKHKAELEVWRGQAEGLSTIMINPSVILGPGNWDQGPPRFFKRIFEGQKFYPIGGTGFVDVRDVAEIAILAMESGLEGERIIVNAENLSFKNFFGSMASALGVNPPKTEATPFMANLAWRTEAIKARLFGGQPLLTRETAKTAMSTFLFDNQKSRSLFHFSYRPVQQTIEWTANEFLRSTKT
ncbi:MAG: NAD-dependent epimerase/dehydratase family protein [Saprospiraceae bacterium]|nr:NAD-dependent epimerase/dehydratase family protein [Saprospiraceae bacterium]